ncbi:restriction endonuclease [Natronosalvus amylolyticus]|uniref:restriction endonuclease n=1 Tax=Natronosalvus amylolyticus TaxID=2961994 RepID=UPI0020C98160|nr:restriction endonuclease [Natronosalvus amylolyticus]
MNLENIQWREFEELIAVLWEKFGYKTRITPPGRDGGIDVIAERSVPYQERILIQVKNYSIDNKIGVKFVREYSSLLHRPNVDGVVIVTTGFFTKQARDEAREIGVKLVDRSEIERFIDEHISELQLSKFTREPNGYKGVNDAAELETSEKPTEVDRESSNSESRTLSGYDRDNDFPKIAEDDPVPDVTVPTFIRDGIREHLLSNSQYMNAFSGNDKNPIYQYISTIHQIPISGQVNRDAIMEICDKYNLQYIDNSEQNIAVRWEKYWNDSTLNVNLEHDSMIATKFINEICEKLDNVELKQTPSE